jgi:hypothetical protein
LPELFLHCLARQYTQNYCTCPRIQIGHDGGGAHKICRRDKFDATLLFVVQADPPSNRCHFVLAQGQINEMQGHNGDASAKDADNVSNRFPRYSWQLTSSQAVTYPLDAFPIRMNFRYGVGAIC